MAFRIPLRPISRILLLGIVSTALTFGPIGLDKLSAAEPPKKSPPKAEAAPKANAEKPPVVPVAQPSPTKKPAPAVAPAAAPAKKPAAAPTVTARQAKQEKPAGPVKLRFQFRFQPWIDVLQWLAEQADLSLVLDAPPPGSFNYTDTREYTPTEAIDLINGVLLTKGYTLIRRDRMLVLVNLEDRIPESLIPRIGLDELSKRGQFEWVTVVFPLEGRKVDEVEKEISPLLSAHGKAVPLPKTGSLMVTDAAGTVRAVQGMIKSIPKPSAAAVAKPSAAKKTFAAYPIKKADPKAVLEILEKLYPDTPINLDEKLGQINAHLTEAQQATVKKIVEGIESGEPADQRALLETYTLGGALVRNLADRLSLVNLIKAVAPEVEVSQIEGGKKMVIWASPEEQKTIGLLIETFSGEGTEAGARQMEVFRLTPTASPTIATTVQELFPQARIVYNRPGRQLIVMATAEQLGSIRATLKQLRIDAGGDISGQRKMQIHTLTRPINATLIAGLAELAPGARISLQPGSKSLAVVATPKEQTAIAEAIRELDRAAADQQLQVYDLKKPAPPTLVGLLRQVAPGAQVTLQPGGRRLVVIGSAQDQTAAKKVIDQADQLTDEAILKVYPFDEPVPPTLLSVLKQMVPTARVIPQADRRRLTVIANQADHGAIQKLLEQTKDWSENRQVEFVPLKDKAPPTLIPTLRQLVPGAQVTLQPGQRRLLVVATPNDLAAVRRAIEKFGETPSTEKPQLEVFRLDRLNPHTTLALVRGLVPGARLTLDPTAKKLIAWAVPTELETIRKTLNQLQPGGLDEDAPKLRYYQLAETPPASLLASLRTLVPGVRITVEPDGKTLSVVATPEDHAVIDQTLKQVEETAPLAERNVLKTYAVTPTDKKRFLAVLPTLRRELPGIQVMPDPAPDALVLWATPTQQQRIASTIDQLRDSTAGEKARVLIAYPITTADPQSVVRVLAELFPAAKVILDAKVRRLAVYATPEEQETIAGVIEQMDAEGAEGARDKMVVYSIGPTPPNVAIGVLREVAPDARITPNRSTRSLIVWALPKSHEKIAATLKQLQAAPQDPNRPVMEVYRYGKADPRTVRTTLQPLTPSGRISVDETKGTINVWATPEEQKTIAAAMAKIAEEEPESTAPRVVRYSIAEAASPNQVLSTLRQIVPKARVSFGTDRYELIVWGRPEDQKIVADVVQSVSGEGDPEKAPRLATYSLKEISTPAALSLIRQLLPQVHVTYGAKQRQLVVWGRPNQQKKVQELLAEIDKPEPAENAPKLETYTLKHVPLGTAIAVLRQAAAGVWMSRGQQADQIVVWGKPVDQEKVRKALEEIDREEPPEKKPKTQTFTLKNTRPQTILPMIQRAFPGRVTMSYGPQADQISAHARPDDLKKIGELITRLDLEESPAIKADSAVFTFKNVLPHRVYPILAQAFYGRISLFYGPQPNQLTVRGRAAELKKVGQMIQRLDQPESAETKFATKVYTLKHAQPVSVLPLINRALYGKIASFYGPQPNQFTVQGRPVDQAKVQELLDQLDQPEAEATSVAYTIKHTTPAALLYLLRQGTQNRASFTYGPQPNQLTARARAADHEKIRKLLEQFDREESPEVKPTLVTYKFKALSPTTVIPILRAAFPRVLINRGAQPNELILRARPAEHKQIQAMIDQIDQKAATPESTPVVQVYTLDGMNVYTLLPLLRQAAPQATFLPGATIRQLIVRAIPEDQEKIGQLIDQLVKQSTGKHAAQVKVYTLKTKNAYRVVPAIRTAAPQARVAAGALPDQLVINATPTEHETIQEIVDTLNQAASPKTAARAVIYPLESMPASGLIYILRQSFPTVGFSVGADRYQLIAMASPEEQEQIKQAIQKLTEGVPEGEKMVLEIYRLKSRPSYQLNYALGYAFPRARFAVGADPRQLLVRARKSDQEKIRAMIDKMTAAEPAETAPRAVVYPLESTTAVSAIRSLRTAFPGVGFSVGADPYQLVAVARPEEQELLKRAIDKLTQALPEAQRLTLEVYRFNQRLTNAILVGLRRAFPRAQFALGADTRQLLVRARSAEQSKIKAMVDKMLSPETAETAPRAEVYHLEKTTAASALRALMRTFPEAAFTVGATPYELVVVARPAQQKLIGAALEQMRFQEGDTDRPTLEVYPLKATGALSALYTLRVSFPDARFSVGADPKNLVVWARPEKQKQIKEAIDQIELAGKPQDKWVMATYPVRYEDTTALLRVLDPILKGQSRFATDPKRDGLIVWADPDRQKKIKTAIDTFLTNLPKSREPVSKVYYFKKANPAEVYPALARLVPTARMSVNSRNRSLVVSATPKDQKRIAQAVAEIEQTADQGEEPVLEAYRIDTANPRSVYTTLANFFRARRDIRLTLDAQNDTIHAMAPPTDQETIRSLIDQVDQEGDLLGTGQLEVYSVENVDTYALMNVLRTLLQNKLARVRMTIDRRTDQLVAIARPAEQKIIAQTVEKLRSEPKTLEILQLGILDPEAALLAIDRLFESDTYGYDPTAPDVQVDGDTQQLFIRATPEQHTQIRRLLVKMGETGLKRISADDSPNRRVVPFSGNVQAAVEQIQRVWPKLRDNPIRISTPSEKTPKPQPQTKPIDQAPSTKSARHRPGQLWGATVRLASTKTDVTKKETPKNEVKTPVAAQSNVEKPKPQPQPKKPATPATPDPQPQKPAASTPVVEAQGPDVILIPGPGSITVQSDDPVALEQMEALLRSMAPEAPTVDYGSRNLEIFRLKHTDATEMAAQLQGLFRQMTRGRARSAIRREPTTIFPNERLNAIVVRGSRTDRATVSHLIELLDTPQVPEDLTYNRPFLVPIKNTEAARIMTVVNDLFRNELRRGARYSRMTPRVSVDEASNALIVMAQEPLRSRIVGLAESIDEAATAESARSIELIRMKKISAQQIGDMLNAPRPRRSSYRRRR